MQTTVFRGWKQAGVNAVKDFESAFTLGLRALELASDRVKVACDGDDIDVAAIETQFGLHAVYDLHETFFLARGISEMKKQDLFLASTGGGVVGALALARGARTHRLVQFASVGGFGDVPYGMGPFGGGWIWKDHSWASRHFQIRASWYEMHVRWRYLWTPLDEAWIWFSQHLLIDGDVAQHLELDR